MISYFSGVSKNRYFVYALMCQDGDGPLYIKFGKTNDPNRRLGELRTGTPIPAIRFAYVEVVGNVTQKHLELGLHKRFADRRTRGEWFRFDAKEDKDAFNAGCKAEFERNVIGKYWSQTDVKALEAAQERRRLALLKSPHWQKVVAGRNAARRSKAADKELDSYR